MITHQSRGVIQARLYIGTCKAWIFLQYLLDGITRSEKLQNSLHCDARATNDRPTVTNIRIN